MYCEGAIPKNLRTGTMESKEVGKEVALRLEIERQVREQLTNLENKIDVPPKNHWAWLESKLSLLLIGSGDKRCADTLVPTHPGKNQLAAAKTATTC